MMKEQDILASVARQIKDPTVLHDDAYFDSDTRQIYTTDMLIEGVHFSLDYFLPEDLGWKAAAVNISDIAGMGGELKFLMISLGLPQGCSQEFIKGFYHGIHLALDAFGGQVIGGDTVRAEKLTLNITAIGELPIGHSLGQRSGAKAGDLIVTTGYPALSYVGLQLLSKKAEGLTGDFTESKERHRRPRPRIEAGLALSKTYERYSLMDTSDGLADATLKIGKASQIRMELIENQIPCHPELLSFLSKSVSKAELRQAMLYGGEDFELLATIPDSGDAIPKGFSVVGKVKALEGGELAGAFLLDDSGRVIEALSLEKTYQHF